MVGKRQFLLQIDTQYAVALGGQVGVLYLCAGRQLKEFVVTAVIRSCAQIHALAGKSDLGELLVLERPSKCSPFENFP